MHSPLSVQDDAHFRDASGPAPLLIMSMMPVMTSTAFAPAIPAGSTLGQTSTHLPHRMHASSICSTRPLSAASNVISSIGRTPVPEAGNRLAVALDDFHRFSATQRSERPSQDDRTREEEDRK